MGHEQAEDLYMRAPWGFFSWNTPLRVNATLRLPSYQEDQAMERNLEATAENPS